MDVSKSTQLLDQLRALSEQAKNNTVSNSLPTEENADGLAFSSVIKDAIDGVNAKQKASAELTKAFELNDPNVPLSDVMIEMQKARVSFEALKQVRNQLINAYKEVMSMPL